MKQKEKFDAFMKSAEFAHKNLTNDGNMNGKLR